MCSVRNWQLLQTSGNTTLPQPVKLSNMSSRRKRQRSKGGPRGQPVSMAPPAVSSPTQPFLSPVEVSPTPKMPAGFNLDDFLFSKLYKSVTVEGKRTITEVLRAVIRQCMKDLPEDASTNTLSQILSEINLDKSKIKSIITKLDKSLLEKNPFVTEFDLTCGIRLLQQAFYKEYKKLPTKCRTQIHSLRELRNSLSHNYPLSLPESESHDAQLRILLEKNVEFVTLVNEIKNLEEKKTGCEESERNKIEHSIREKKKEKHVVTEIEKLKVTLIDILECMGTVLKEDFTNCKKMVEKNLIEISSAKVQQIDQDTYDRQVKSFKNDPIHELITKAREELKYHYKRLKLANPCPWMLWDQIEKSSVLNFSIDKIYTPLRIEGSKSEISTEELLLREKKFRGHFMVPPALVLFGLAGSGKTSLCLHLLHHWTEGTDDINMLASYNLVIFVELRTARSNTLVSYLKEKRMKSSTKGIHSDDLVQQLDDLKLLFIIDGYDEAKEASKEIVKDIFAHFPDQRILVTTRGEFREEVKKVATKYNVVYDTLEICGFDDERIEKFTEKVFNVVKQTGLHAGDQQHTAFLQYVQGRGRILEKHLELPLTLALMIYLWIDCPDTLSRVTTCTSLYYELFNLCQKKLKSRLSHPCSDNDLEMLLFLVGKKAWQLLQNEETLLSSEDEKNIDDHCKEKRIPKQELLSAFLMYECDDNADEDVHYYSFMHKTQMEYLSAYFLAEEAEKNGLQGAMGTMSSLSGFHQVLIFLIGHFSRKEVLEKNLGDILELLDKADVESDNFDFWLRLLTESHNNKNLTTEISKEKLPKHQWKLCERHVVSGLELLIATPAKIKELIIEIKSGIDPYEIKDLLSTMCSLKTKLKSRYNKKNVILTELFFWQHFQTKCPKPSDELLRTLYPWGHLRNFTGSLGQQKQDCETLRYCFKVKNLRIRIDTIGAEVSLANSLERIQGNVRQLRVILVLNPEECDPNALACLTFDQFKGDLELTLPNMNIENKEWIVQVVKKVSGRHGCCKLFLERSSLTFPTVLFLMMKLRDVVLQKLTIESNDDLTMAQLIEKEKQEKMTHIGLEWMCR